jgi:hypothetical protein
MRSSVTGCCSPGPADLLTCSLGIATYVIFLQVELILCQNLGGLPPRAPAPR